MKSNVPDPINQTYTLEQYAYHSWRVILTKHLFFINKQSFLESFHRFLHSVTCWPQYSYNNGSTVCCPLIILKHSTRSQRQQHNHKRPNPLQIFILIQMLTKPQMHSPLSGITMSPYIFALLSTLLMIMTRSAQKVNWLKEENMPGYYSYLKFLNNVESL